MVAEEISRIADEWPAIEQLLPLCDDAMNRAAQTGQVEAGERIAEAISARFSSLIEDLK